MNRIVWSCAALLTLCVTVESLTCYTCDVEFLGTCFKKSHLNCTAPRNSCYKAFAKFISDPLEIHDRGCIAEADCANTTGSVLNVNYTITRYCCNTDLCNGVASIHLPLTTALCAALVAVWSQWSL